MPSMRMLSPKFSRLKVVLRIIPLLFTSHPGKWPNVVLQNGRPSRTSCRLHFGPALTMVLNRSEKNSRQCHRGGKTVGVRWPSHPFIQAVIRECGFPLAAPSANLSNSISPTNAEHVQRSLGGQIKLIVDGGQSQVGIESTVLDLTAHPVRVLRPGMIHEESLLSVVGEFALGFADSEEVLKSPGMLRKHYSPKAKLLILNWADESDLKSQIAIEWIAYATILKRTSLPTRGFR